VVVITQLLALALTLGPLATVGELQPTLAGTDPSMGAFIGSAASGFAGWLATELSAILLSGMLTVIVGRAVFGAGITIGEAWQRLRGRIWALIGYSLMWLFGEVALIAIGFGLVFWIGFAAGTVPALVIGLPLAFALFALLIYLWAILAFAPAVIVLERTGIFAAIERSFHLVKKDFWRVLGIRILAVIVTSLIAAAVSIPFSIGGELLAMGSSTAAMTVLALALLTVGGAIGQIITAPFTAGVAVLQYTDMRMRAEAFDLVLQTGAAHGIGAPSDSTDDLWLRRQP
jgi:hypothetical protein